MINKVLRLFGYIIFKKSFLEKRYLSIKYSNLYEHIFLNKLHSKFFFIQIGANDGVRNDPIFHLVTKYNVKGIVLEPVPNIFEKLKSNYKNYPNVKPLNYAIHNFKKESIIYQVDPKLTKYGDRAIGTPSFFKEHHKLNNIDEIDIIEVPVKCISLIDLIKKYELEKVDLLQIDTEGYDYEIIKQMDFSILKPSIISFEHGVRMGIMVYDQLKEIEEILFKEGYKVLIDEHDVRAFL